MVRNTLTGVGGSKSLQLEWEYPHQIRLSNYDVHFASEYPIYGSTIEIQFVIQIIEMVFLHIKVRIGQIFDRIN